MYGKPITINVGFICEKCKKVSPEAKKTCRNHCRSCLYSKHVDKNVPGDRKSTCRGLMEAVFIDYRGKKGYQILHRCLICDKEISNILADDDDMETVAGIMRRQNIEITPAKNDRKKSK